MRNQVMDPEFRENIRRLTGKLSGRFAMRELAGILHVNHTLLYKWRAGTVQPIWLARKAAVRILETLDATSLRS